MPLTRDPRGVEGEALAAVPARVASVPPRAGVRGAVEGDALLGEAANTCDASPPPGGAAFGVPTPEA